MVDGKRLMTRMVELGALYGEIPYKFAVPLNLVDSPFVVSRAAQEQVHELGRLLHEFFSTIDSCDPLLTAGLPQHVVELGGVVLASRHPAPLLRVDAHIFPDRIEVLEINTSAVDGFGITDALMRVAREFGLVQRDGGQAVDALTRVLAPNGRSITLLYSEEFRGVAGEARALNTFGLRGELQLVDQVPNSPLVFPYFKPVHLGGKEPVAQLYASGANQVVPPLKQALDSKRNLLLARDWHKDLKCWIPEVTIEKPPVEERKAWVAKPAHGGSCRGILLGKGTGRAAWERSFDSDPYVFQRFSDAPEGIAIGIHEDGTEEDVRGKVKSNLFFVEGRFVGGFATLAPGRSLVNDNGFNCPLIWQ